MKKTLLLLMFISTVMVSQTLKRPLNSCYNLKQKNENYASGDNYKSYCDIKKQTAFTSCMCEYETKLKNYKEELENNQSKFRSLDREFANLISKASDKSSRGTYLVTGINDSKNFSDDKLKVSELLSDAEYLLNDARNLAYELDDICLKIYNNCEKNKRINRVKELEKSVENAQNTLLNAAPSKTIKIKPGSSLIGRSTDNSKKESKEKSVLSDYQKYKLKAENERYSRLSIEERNEEIRQKQQAKFNKSVTDAAVQIVKLFERSPEAIKRRQEARKRFKKFKKSEEKKYKNAVRDKEDNVVSDGHILFKKKGLYGYKNSQGKVVIKPKFITAERFYNGKAKVTTKFGQKIIINTKGKKI